MEFVPVYSSHLVLFVIVSIGFMLGFAPDSFAANANLFVSAEDPQYDNYMLLAQVVEVKIVDSDISDTTEAKGEPDVTVNGKILRMVQAEDGNWYGYFAGRNAVIQADSDPDDGLEFGIVCTTQEEITDAENFLNIDVSDSAGVAFGATECDGSGFDSSLQNVLTDFDPIPAISPINNGQIGIEPNSWPFIQLYPLNPTGNVVIQYNKGGGAQTTTLTYDDHLPCYNCGGGGGNNEWDTRPTFGVSHETRQGLVVENGFSFNGEYFTITDNHHTDFEKQLVEIGIQNSFSATVYADKKLKVQEFLFGIPNVGESHLAELGVEVWYDREGIIEDIKVIQETDVIDEGTINVTSKKTMCLSTDATPLCTTTTVAMTFLEPLMHDVMAIKAIDYANRDQRTHLNEGFDISGQSLNPMSFQMIPSNMKNQSLIKVTQLAKYSPYWQSDDSRMFEMNSFGSFKEINQSFERFADAGDARTRLHSGFGGILDYEQKRATKVFDSTKLVSEIPDSFGYHFEMTDRFNEQLIDSILEQQEIAKRILEDMDKQNRNY